MLINALADGGAESMTAVNTITRAVRLKTRERLR
jgi:hypothetical protein